MPSLVLGAMDLANFLARLQWELLSHLIFYNEIDTVDVKMLFKSCIYIYIIIYVACIHTHTHTNFLMVLPDCHFSWTSGWHVRN